MVNTQYWTILYIEILNEFSIIACNGRLLQSEMQERNMPPVIISLIFLYIYSNLFLIICMLCIYTQYDALVISCVN